MRYASLADFGGQRRAKPVPPERDGQGKIQERYGIAKDVDAWYDSMKR